MRVLGLDVGTSSVKAAVLDAASGEPVGPVAHAAYALDHPVSDASEVPLERVWKAAVQAGRRAGAGFAGSVEGVGLSCLMPALVVLDGQGQPLAPAWTHLDRRSRPVARRADAEVGAEFLSTTGNRPLPGGISAVCFRQWAEDNPAAAAVRRYLHLNGWLGMQMTDRPAFDPANASFTGLFSTTGDQAWSQRWCDYFGVRRDWLPEVIDGADTLGKLTSRAGEDLGLPAGVPVKLGTADTSSAQLAAGQTPDDLMHVVGTTQVLAAIVHQPRPDRVRLTRRLGVGPDFVHATHNPVGGVALDWLHGLCFHDVRAGDFYGRLIDEALARQTTVGLDPPFLGGDRLEIEPAYAALHGLSLTTDRIDLLAAILTEMRKQHAQAMRNLGGPAVPKKIFLTGGGAGVLRRLIPGYDGDRVQSLEEASLRGVARLFA